MTETREKPILFSGPMVQAILEGRKTQTRRVVKVRELDFVGPGGCLGECKDDPDCWGFADEYGDYWTLPSQGERCGSYEIPCPFGRVDDRIGVRECFWAHPANNWLYQSGNGRIHYDADLDDAQRKKLRAEGWKKKPSIHMPRWASRLTLEITSVKVERLQSISEEDAQAEGMSCRSDLAWGHGGVGDDMPSWAVAHGYRFAFQEAWEKINGAKHPWSSNPWLWVLSFRRVPEARDAGE